MTMRANEQHGKWVFITPIKNLVLSPDINGSIQIDRALFISRQKLPFVMKTFKALWKIGEIKTKDALYGKTFDADSFALVPYSGVPKDLASECIKLIRDELHILSLAQLGYSKRRFSCAPSVQGDGGGLNNWRKYFFIGTTDRSITATIERSRAPIPLKLDKRWKENSKAFFFDKLLKIIRGKIPVDNPWVKCLKRASILAGKSLSAQSVEDAFLCNMIAMETLLAKHGDNYTDVLPKRLEALLGWSGFWKTNNYQSKIQEAYKMRCSYVHDGQKDKITMQELLFSDDLLLNLLMNIAWFPRIFHSKQALIEFSNKVEAEHLLGLRSKVRPKKIRFVSRSYSQEDYEYLL